MTVLLWWLIPLAATMLALLFVGLRARPSKPVDAQQGMADLERFRAAMSKPMPPLRRPSSRPDDVRPGDEVFDQAVADEGATDADHPSGRSPHRRSA